MEAIYNAIMANPAAKAAYLADDNAAVVSALNAKTIAVSPEDPFRTANWLLATFSDAEAALVLGTMKAVAAYSGEDQTQQAMATIVGTALDALKARGLDLSNAKTQAYLDQLAVVGGWPDALRDAIKEEGLRYVSIADQQLGRDAVEQDVLDVREWQGGLVYDQTQVTVSVNKQPNGAVRFTLIKRPTTANGKSAPQQIVANSANALNDGNLSDAVKAALQVLIDAAAA